MLQLLKTPQQSLANTGACSMILFQMTDDRHVARADTLQYLNTDCEIAVHLEMMSYDREGVLERLTLIDGKEVHNNPLDWLKLNSGKYPILSSIARRILCVPATSDPCERLFSYAGLTISNDRNRLLPENAEEFIFLCVAWPKVDSEEGSYIKVRHTL